MKLDIIMQNEDLNLKKCIENEMGMKPKKMYIFAGNIKESGFDIIEENIIDSGVKLSVYMGVDKKNTTKSLLETILNYSKDVFYYNNNEIKEFDGTVLVFEDEKRAAIYVSSGKISENSITEDLVMISRFEYDLKNDEEKRDYKEKVKQLTSIKELEFIELKKSGIADLIDSKIIFSNKQYEHNVKSIAELLGKTTEEKKENKKVKSDEDIVASDFEIPVVDLKDGIEDFDIDVSMVTEISEKASENIKKVENKAKKEEKVDEKFEDEPALEADDDEVVEDDIDEGEELDLNSMLLTKSSVKLKEKSDKDKKKSEAKKEDLAPIDDDAELVKVKKVDLNNVTNFIMQLPAKQQNKKDLDIIKIPNYIRDLIPAFFEFPDKAKVVLDGGITVKERDIKIEILDCKNNKKYIENSSKMFQRKGQTFISILCKNLESIDYEENDIVRIIKLSDDVYHIEIVNKDMQEYKIWEKIMNKNLKSCSRKYGIM